MAKPTAVPKLPAAEMLKLDHQLCFALYSSSLAMTKLYKPLLDRRLILDSGTLTPLLKRLEASGWVARERDSADERRVRVHLTPSGRALKARAVKVPPQVLCATGCSLAEIAALTVQLKALRDE